jgi:thymidylate kinase
MTEPYHPLLLNHSYAFEGPDGCGKSTILAKVSQAIVRKKKLYWGTAEPSSIPPRFISEKQAALWYITDREKNLRTLSNRLYAMEDFTLPSVILFDRCWLSTMVYQAKALACNYEIHGLWGIDYPRTIFVIDRGMDACIGAIKRRGEKVPDNYQDIWFRYKNLQDAAPSAYHERYKIIRVPNDEGMDQAAVNQIMEHLTYGTATTD